MATAPAGGSPGPSPSRAPTYVCPICGIRFDEDRERCGACGSNLVVPVEDGSVYETILAMCGGPKTTCRPPD